MAIAANNAKAVSGGHEYDNANTPIIISLAALSDE